MSEVVWVDSESRLADLIALGGRVVVDFTAPARCQPCKKFAPHYERAASELIDVTFVAVDIDKNDWAVVTYDVRSVPTIKLYVDGVFVRDLEPKGAPLFMNDVKE